MFVERMPRGRGPSTRFDDRQLRLGGRSDPVVGHVCAVRVERGGAARAQSNRVQMLGKAAGDAEEERERVRRDLTARAIASGLGRSSTASRQTWPSR
jgi:hypothetical protein